MVNTFGSPADVHEFESRSDLFFFLQFFKFKFRWYVLGWSTTSVLHFFRYAWLLHILPVWCVKWHAKLQMGYMECKVTNVMKMSILLILYLIFSTYCRHNNHISSGNKEKCHYSSGEQGNWYTSLTLPPSTTRQGRIWVAVFIDRSVFLSVWIWHVAGINCKNHTLSILLYVSYNMNHLQIKKKIQYSPRVFFLVCSLMWFARTCDFVF